MYSHTQHHIYLYYHDKSLWFSPEENNIHVHDLLTFQQITVVSKAKGATLFACDLQVSYSIIVTYSPAIISMHLYTLLFYIFLVRKTTYITTTLISDK